MTTEKRNWFQRLFGSNHKCTKNEGKPRKISNSSAYGTVTKNQNEHYYSHNDLMNPLNPLSPSYIGDTDTINGHDRDNNWTSNHDHSSSSHDSHSSSWDSGSSDSGSSWSSDSSSFDSGSSDCGGGGGD